MTGYESKRAAARDKLDDDDTQVYQDHDDALTIAYQSGYYDGKKAAQPAQEPVAWRYRGNLHEFDPSDWATGPVTPLYTAPAQRPWVGLTDEEIIEIHSAAEGQSVGVATGLTERKLKEKNT